MIPISKWEDLTEDKEAIQTLKEVYGDDVEELDLLVGLMAEKKIKGFAIINIPSDGNKVIKQNHKYVRKIE